MNRNMVSSDIHSKRGRTAKFRALNNSSTDALPEPNRTRSSTMLRQRPSQILTNFERKSFSQLQEIPDQLSLDRRVYSNRFADHIYATKPRQSINLKKEFLNHPADELKDKKDSKWYMEPIVPFPCRSTSKMEYKDHVERDCAMLKTSPITASPSVHGRQPITPAIKRELCECSGHSMIFQNQFIDKLSPVQRKTSLYSTNIKTLKSDLPIYTDKNNQSYKRQAHYQHHHHLQHPPQCFTPQIMKKWQLKDNIPKVAKKDIDECKIPNDHHRKSRTNSVSNKNRNSTTEASRRVLKDEDIVKVFELMVKKLVRKGTDVDKELLNELCISMLSSPRRDKENRKTRDTSLSSSSPSSSPSTTLPTTSGSSESSDESTKNENFTNNKNKFTKIKQFRKLKKTGEDEQPQNEDRKSPEISSSSHQQIQQIQKIHPHVQLHAERCEDRCQSSRARSGRSSFSSKRSQVQESIPEGRSSESKTWNTTNIRKLKMAVDDLFENILETNRVDHDSVATEYSLEGKELRKLNCNNNNEEYVENRHHHRNNSAEDDDDDSSVNQSNEMHHSNSNLDILNHPDENYLETIDIKEKSGFDKITSELVDCLSTGKLIKPKANNVSESTISCQTKNQMRDEDGFRVKGHLMAEVRGGSSSESKRSLDKANQTSSCLSQNLQKIFQIESPKNFKIISNSKGMCYERAN